MGFFAKVEERGVFSLGRGLVVLEKLEGFLGGRENREERVWGLGGETEASEEMVLCKERKFLGFDLKILRRAI